jgi:hypothetical protein
MHRFATGLVPTITRTTDIVSVYTIRMSMSRSSYYSRSSYPTGGLITTRPHTYLHLINSSNSEQDHASTGLSHHENAAIMYHDSDGQGFDAFATMPKFSGGRTENIDDFIDRVNVIMEHPGATERDLMFKLIDSTFTGSAKKWAFNLMGPRGPSYMG